MITRFSLIYVPLAKVYKWKLFFSLLLERGTACQVGMDTDRERKLRVQDLFVHVHFGELLVPLLERIDMILFSYINSLLRNPFGDTLERVNKDVHCSIIYSDKSSINLCWKIKSLLCKYEEFS